MEAAELQSSPASKEGRVLSKVEMGAKIRAARKAQKMTLVELSGRSGVSLSSLSKAERGLVALSYEKFLAVSQSLAMDLTDLFSFSAPRQAPAVVVNRANEAVIYRAHRYLYGMLATEWAYKKMTPMFGRVEPGVPVDAADFSKHAGEEFIFVLEGSLTMEFEDGSARTLNKHDSIYFDSALGHHYICASPDPVEILVVCVNEGADSAGPAPAVR